MSIRTSPRSLWTSNLPAKGDHLDIGLVSDGPPNCFTTLAMSTHDPALVAQGLALPRYDRPVKVTLRHLVSGIRHDVACQDEEHARELVRQFDKKREHVAAVYPAYWGHKSGAFIILSASFLRHCVAEFGRRALEIMEGVPSLDDFGASERVVLELYLDESIRLRRDPEALLLRGNAIEVRRLGALDIARGGGIIKANFDNRSLYRLTTYGLKRLRQLRAAKADEIKHTPFELLTD